MEKETIMIVKQLLAVPFGAAIILLLHNKYHQKTKRLYEPNKGGPQT